MNFSTLIGRLACALGNSYMSLEFISSLFYLFSFFVFIVVLFLTVRKSKRARTPIYTVALLYPVFRLFWSAMHGMLGNSNYSANMEHDISIIRWEIIQTMELTCIRSLTRSHIISRKNFTRWIIDAICYSLIPVISLNLSFFFRIILSYFLQ